jgi:hypothetical protein
MFMLSLAVMAFQGRASVHVLARRHSDHFKPTIRLTKDRPFEVKLTVLDGKRVVWYTELGANYEACVFRKDRMVVYFAERTGLIARRFNGTIVWNLPLDLRSPHIDFASGNFLLESSLGPTPSFKLPLMKILQCSGSMMVDVHTGKELWGGDAYAYISDYAIGSPCWMNDRVFVDTREDFISSQAKFADQEHAGFPTWVEVRRIRDHALLWRRRFKGRPIREPLQRANSRQLKFYYNPSTGDDAERSHPRQRMILVPVRRRSTEAREQTPILYTVPRDP